MDTMYADNPIRKRINKIFDSHIVGDSSEALNTISGFYSSNSTNTKRVLINEIEKRDMIVSKNVLLEYRKLKDNLNKIFDTISSLDGAVKDMSKRLNDSKTKTHHLISQTTKLKDESKKTEKKILWVNTFVNQFQLSQDQKEYLNNVPMKTPLTADFLLTLSNIENLYEKSKSLVKCWYQTSAFDLMEIIGMQQEVAIEKLYHWTVGACRMHTQHQLVPKALAKFENRQVLFSNILDEYCTARKTLIVQSFIDALTKGRENGGNPIEFYANDPKHYINDLLTWVYQIIPIEKENLNILFKHCQIIDKNEQITEILVNIMESICSLLKVRAELMLKPDKGPLVLWSITNLFIYYKVIIQSSVPKGNLIETLEYLLQKSEEVFVMSLDSKIQQELSHGVKAPTANLSPSNIVTDLVSFLRELLGTMNVSNAQAVDKKLIITHLLDPLLKAINETACHLSSTDMSVYMLNCIYHIQCTLSLYPVMDEYNERLQAQSEAQIDTLTSEQASYLVANLNLGPIYTILQENISGSMSAIPGMDTPTLKTFLNKFDMFLVSPGAYLLSQMSLLSSQNHKGLVKKRSFEVIQAIYNQLYAAVNDPSNGYVDPQSIVRRTPDEVKTILS